MQGAPTKPLQALQVALSKPLGSTLHGLERLFLGDGIFKFGGLGPRAYNRGHLQAFNKDLEAAIQEKLDKGLV